MLLQYQNMTGLKQVIESSVIETVLKWAIDNNHEAIINELQNNSIATSPSSAPLNNKYDIMLESILQTQYCADTGSEKIFKDKLLEYTNSDGYLKFVEFVENDKEYVNFLRCFFNNDSVN